MVEKLPRSLLSPLRVRVLWALLRHPSFSAKEIAEVVQCKPSTVYTVLRTLTYHGALEKSYALSPEFLGVELFALHVIPRSILGRAREIRFLSELLEYLPCAVYSLMLDGETIILSMATGYGDLKRCISTIRSFLSRGPWSPQDLETLIFPREMSSTTGIFSYHRAVEKLLLKPPPEESEEERQCSISMEELSWGELLVLAGLLHYPGLSDSQLANILKKGRRGVSRIREKLLERGAIRPITLPALTALPLDSLFFVRAKDPALRRREEMEELTRVIRGSLPFMSCWNHFSLFSISTLLKGEEDMLRQHLAEVNGSGERWIKASSTPMGRVRVLKELDYLSLLEMLMRERFFRE